jgi:superfamily I DNA and RNA helicase
MMTLVGNSVREWKFLAEFEILLELSGDVGKTVFLKAVSMIHTSTSSKVVCTYQTRVLASNITSTTSSIFAPTSEEALD